MVIDRYKIKKDTDSGIINDPNGWFENPRDLITAIERIVHVSVESTKIIENLPAQVTPD
jgi:predicted helicase